MAWQCLYSYHGEKYGPQDSVDGIQPGDLNGKNDLISCDFSYLQSITSWNVYVTCNIWMYMMV